MLASLGCDPRSAENARVPKRSAVKYLTLTDVNAHRLTEDTVIPADHPADRQLIEQFRRFINAIDSLYKADPAKIELYVKLAGQDTLQRVKNFDNLPSSLVASYNVYRDARGTIRYVLASPFSESGDWLNTLVHYFDADGRTVAFVRTSNFLNSGCTDGTAYEIAGWFFNPRQELIGKTYELKDAQGQLLVPDSCTFHYRKPYRVFADLRTLKQQTLLQ